MDFPVQIQQLKWTFGHFQTLQAPYNPCIQFKSRFKIRGLGIW